jgi:hypothetical protein
MLAFRGFVSTCVLFTLAAACGSSDGGTGSGSADGSGDDDGDDSGGSSTGGSASTSDASASASADGTSGASAESTGADAGTTGDPCDCPMGANTPVCGVDGMTYDATCGAQCVPVDIACNGECPCPAFMCGDAVCRPGEVVCTTVVPGVPNVEPTSTCGPLPATCSQLPDPDCTCFESSECDCMETPEGWFEVTCYAP